MTNDEVRIEAVAVIHHSDFVIHSGIRVSDFGFSICRRSLATPTLGAPMLNLLATLYRVLIRFGVYLLPLVLLIIRLAWGWELFESGRSHIQDVPTMVQRFTDWGVPFPKPNVYLSASIEMVG